VSLMLTLNFFY